MSIRQISIALIGFGNTGRRLAELLVERAGAIEERYKTRIVCTAIATAHHGSIVSGAALDLSLALDLVRHGKPLMSLPGVEQVKDSFEAISRSSAEVVIETTPLNVDNAEPALTHIRRALETGKHVITANKGPLAFAAREIQALAASNNLYLRYESTVMDGAPLFNLVNRTLPLIEIKSMRGIINSTTNFILTRMEQGSSFDEALSEAQRRGIAEADPGHDIDGWDAAVKAAVLANSLMGADLKPGMISREGIRHLERESLIEAYHSGKRLRLVTTIERIGDRVEARVGPEEIEAGDLLYVIDAFSNALIFETDLMGTIAIVEQNPELTQTAYGLLSDLLSIL
jgi:homoserine dehydrogenase